MNAIDRACIVCTRSTRRTANVFGTTEHLCETCEDRLRRNRQELMRLVREAGQ